MTADIRQIVRDAMDDAWTEICADTECHPLDIEQRGKTLFFSPKHWSDLTASHIERALGWHTIDSAPKDGTHIIVINMERGDTLPATVHWFDGGWHLSVNQMGDYSDYVWGDPTHWMHRPALPATVTRSGKVVVRLVGKSEFMFWDRSRHHHSFGKRDWASEYPSEEAARATIAKAFPPGFIERNNIVFEPADWS